MTEIQDTPRPSEPAAAAQVSERLARLQAALNDLLLGQERVVERLVTAYVSGGHALLQGAPGTGKTLLARGFAAALGVDFQRIQFTPDLMPADVIGTNVLEGGGAFRLVRGPVFTQVLMADEINRTPPKTQAALLEGMQERQVTIDGTSYPLPKGFFVVATQNPIEFEGTYPLPEAQLDRFLMRILVDLPGPEAEVEIYRRAVAGTLGGFLAQDRLPEAQVTEQEAQTLRQAAATVHVSEDILDYLARLAGAVRSSDHVELSVSPRGALALLAASRGRALVEGRDFVSPEDLKQLLEPCWGHRILLTAESELEGLSPRSLLEEIASGVEVPR